VRRIEQTRRLGEESSRFRAEAAALLGIADAPKATDGPRPKP